MDGLEFVTALEAPPRESARVDVACFVGFVARRGDVTPQAGESDGARLQRVLPPWVRDWLVQRRWMRLDSDGLDLPGRVSDLGRTADQLAELDDVPVPLESWDSFDELFDWDNRGVEVTESSRRAGTRLGAAVQEFFERGGRRAYVVRVGDPLPVFAGRAARLARVHRLIPNLFGLLGPRAASFNADTLSAWAEILQPVSPADPTTWRGIGHLLGLPDVSFLLLPDLPDLLAAEQPSFVPAAGPRRPERFVELQDAPLGRVDLGLRSIPAPRCDAQAFEQWAALVGGIGEFFASRRNGLRETQFIGALPLPIIERDSALAPGSAGAADPLTRAYARVQAARQAQWTAAATVQTAFVQLVYPWLRTFQSHRQPAGLAAPDGTWGGLLAANALTNGTWRSLQRTELPGILAVEPMVDPSVQQQILPWLPGSTAANRTIRERITLIGPVGGGLRVLSDVTTDDDDAYRQGSVCRLTAALLRAARTLGETFVFRSNGPRLWRELKDAFEALLEQLWTEGALDGTTPQKSFTVRCDPSTMSQADIDAGRLVAEIAFQPAANIERIVVVLAMDDGGQVSLIGLRPEAQRREAA